MCRERQLYQVDLLNPAADRITEQEYFAERRGQEKLNKRNAEISAAGLTPRTTKFETRKETLRKQISEIAENAKSFSEFEKALFEKYGISVRDKRGRFSYKLPDREKPVSARSLGTSYDRDHLLALFADNAKGISRERNQSAHQSNTQAEQNPKYSNSGIRLLVDLENCIKAQQSRAYAQKVKITNLQQMAQTYAYVQTHGYDSAEQLKNALDETKTKASDAQKSLKDTESKIRNINKQIRLTGQFFANRDIYTQYRKSGKSADFYEKHRAEIALYETARDALRELSGGEKLPNMRSLKEEKGRLTAIKNAEYATYQNTRNEKRDLQTIYANVCKMLGIDDETKAQSAHLHDTR